MITYIDILDILYGPFLEELPANHLERGLALLEGKNTSGSFTKWSNRLPRL